MKLQIHRIAVGYAFCIFALCTCVGWGCSQKRVYGCKVVDGHHYQQSRSHWEYEIVVQDVNGNVHTFTGLSGEEFEKRTKVLGGDFYGQTDDGATCQ